VRAAVGHFTSGGGGRAGQGRCWWGGRHTGRVNAWRVGNAGFGQLCALAALPPWFAVTAAAGGLCSRLARGQPTELAYLVSLLSNVVRAARCILRRAHPANGALFLLLFQRYTCYTTRHEQPKRSCQLKIKERKNLQDTSARSVVDVICAP
jgi:hypothetical protein